MPITVRAASRVFALVVAILAVFTGRANAQANPEWMAQFPTPDRVIQLISGKDETDTKARQAAALYEMDRLVRRLTGNEYSNKWKGPDSTRLLAASYHQADERLSNEFAAKLNAGISTEKLADPKFARPSKAFNDAAYRYRINATFQRETFVTVLGADWVTKWYDPLVAHENKVLGQVRKQTQQTYEDQKSRGDAIAARDRESANFRTIRILLGLVFFAGAGAWILKTWRRVRLGATDPYDLRGTSKKLASISGVVSGMNTYTTTQTSSYRENPLPGQQGPGALRTTTTSTTHREFFLETPEGTRPFHLVDSSAPLADGQLATCVWVQPKKAASTKESGGNVLFVMNHDTDMWYLRPKTLYRLAGVGFKPFFPVAIAAALLGGIVFAVLAIVGYVIAWNIGMWIRTRQFKRHEIPRLEQYVKERAPAWTPSPQ